MKSKWQSKTLWLNGAFILTAWLLNHKGVMAAAGLDADTQVVILAVLNFLNRFRTTEPLS